MTQENNDSFDLLLMDSDGENTEDTNNANYLTHWQHELIYAVETVNYSYFVDLGGLTTADINFDHGKQKMFPLMIAAAKGLQVYVITFSHQFVETMLQNQFVIIDQQDAKGVNAFWTAAFYGHGQVMSVLAEAGINIMNTNKAGKNVLHVAAKKDYSNVVQMLIKSKFPLNSKTYKGHTAAALAAANGNLSVLKILHQAGAAINLVTSEGIGALYMAILREQQQCSTYLIENGAQLYYPEMKHRDLSPIFLATQLQNREVLEQMCDHGCSLEVQNSHGQTPLIFAAQKKCNDIVNYLSLRKTDLNQEDFNSLTILMHYLFSNDFKMAGKLIARGASMDYVNRNGNTAFHLVIENNLEKAIEFLFEHNADPHIVDFAGEDACDKAKKSGLALVFPEFNNCNPNMKKSSISGKGVPNPDMTQHSSSLNIIKKESTFVSQSRRQHQKNSSKDLSQSTKDDTEKSKFQVSSYQDTTLNQSNSNFSPNQRKSIVSDPTTQMIQDYHQQLEDKLKVKLEQIQSNQTSELRKVAQEMKKEIRSILQDEKSPSHQTGGFRGSVQRNSNESGSPLRVDKFIELEKKALAQHRKDLLNLLRKDEEKLMTEIKQGRSIFADSVKSQINGRKSQNLERSGDGFSQRLQNQATNVDSMISSKQQ